MKFNKEDIIALILSILIHFLIFILLYVCVFKRIIPVKDDGIYVNYGDFIDGKGEFEPKISATAQQIVKEIPTPKPQPETNKEIITQDEEETVHIPNTTKKKKEKLAENKPLQTKKQPTEEERLKEEQRKQREKEERQAGNINDNVSNAFNRANTQGSSQGNAQNGGVSGLSENSVNDSRSQGNETSDKNQGNPFGNSNVGPSQGIGGFGSFDLAGRTLRGGELPRPGYEAQDEGKIVIDITVDSNGNVIFAEIGKGTNISDAKLRQSAISAAKQAKFNKTQESNNQNGTITYKYKYK